MIAGLIAGSGAVVAVAIALTILGMALRSAEERASNARVADAEKAGKIAIDAATIATLQSALADEKARSDALDHALDEAAASGDAAGARDRVLQRWHQARGGADAAGGHGPIPVPADSAAGAAGPVGDRQATRL